LAGFKSEQRLIDVGCTLKIRRLPPAGFEGSEENLYNSPNPEPETKRYCGGTKQIWVNLLNSVESLSAASQAKGQRERRPDPQAQ